MTNIFKTLLLTILLMPLTGCWADDVEPQPGDSDTIAPGPGKVIYNAYKPLASRPITLHYNIPTRGDMTSMPVLFVLPGLERNASDYLNSWKASSDAKQFMVFALEFPADTYSTDQYIEGGMFDNGTAVRKEDWTFSIIEPLFDFIKASTGNRSVDYDIWGHSAGGQFVHRYVTFMTEARIDRAVTANAGWYTLPETGTLYPYGLKDSGMADSETLRHLFATELIVQLGTADTDRDGLNTTPGAEAQGATRFARGNNYFSTGESVAAQGHYEFKWSRREVKGVGHDHTAMAADAAIMLY